jgi:hypothetical protein
MVFVCKCIFVGTAASYLGLVLRWLVVWLACMAGTAMAAGPYPITWNWPSNETAAAVQAQYPWMHLEPERVNLDISLDGGTVYRPLAQGVPSAYGDNTWHFQLPDAKEWLTGAGIVRVSSMPMYGRTLAVHASPVVIAGIHLINPPASVTNGASVTLRWVAAGAGVLVTLGTRAIGEEEWVAQAVFASVDSNQGATTNSAVWAVAELQAGPTEIILQSLADPICYRRATLEVAP